MKKQPLCVAVAIISFASIGCSDPTPEAAVESFFEATKAGNEDKAKKHVTENMLASWDQDYESNQQLHENHEVTMKVIDTAEISDDTARVKVEWAYSDEGGSGTSIITFRVRKTDGNWLVDEAGVSFLDEFPEAEKDSQGKTPYDYAERYYTAINEEDFPTLRKLHADSYAEHVIRNAPGGEKDKSDDERFAYGMNQRMHKSKDLIPRPDASGFLRNNAEGVFSVAYKLIPTDEYARKREREILERHGVKTPFDEINTALSFKMVDGVWKITNKFGM